MRLQTESACSLTAARDRTDALFQLVRPDALYRRPIPERHRMVFYLGHVEAFDWNLLARYALDVPAFHAEFDRLFAFGIDPPPGQLPCDAPSEWPTLEEIARYNSRTRQLIDEHLDAVPDQLMHAAIEHRLMHAETFSYILHQLEYADKLRPEEAGSMPPAPIRFGASPWCEMAAGRAHLGRTQSEGFGWDNEFPAYSVDVSEFAIARYKVTNGEYLEYVQAGAAPPFFWRLRDGHWFYRGMFGEVPLPLDCPVYVTWSEADGFARWRGMRLPTEAEWMRAAEGAPPSDNADFRYWDPTPAVSGDRGGVRPIHMAGNGWEWTSTVFAGFPGFEPFPFYRNYSEPFFDGQHYVLKGASPRTAACFLRPTFRNWFRPEYPYTYSTFRLVRS